MVCVQLQNDVEVLQLKVHTIIHRTSDAVIDRIREYISAELTRTKLETAVRREQVNFVEEMMSFVEEVMEFVSKMMSFCI